MRREKIGGRTVTVREKISSEVTRALKQAILDELDRCNGDVKAVHANPRFDSHTVNRFRLADSDFDAAWTNLRKEPHNPYGPKDTIENREAFLEGLKKGLSPSASAREIGVCYTTVKAWRAKDREFTIAWDDALDEGTDGLEDEAHRRAVTGISKPVYYKGEVVGETVEYSDGLLNTLLQARRPWKFRRFQDSNPNASAPAFVVQADLSKLTPDELARLYRETLGHLNGG